jgi:ubiquinol-cytochrome c reductase iron-sulfur subunit
MTEPPRSRRLRDTLLGAALVRLLRRLPASEPPREPGVPPPDIERELPSTRGAERTVLVALLGTVVAAAGFIVLYVALPDTQLLGLCLGLAFVCLAVGSIVAGKKVVPQETTIEEREELGDRETQEEVVGIVRRGGEGVSRRGMLLGAAGAAGAAVGAAAIVPAASLGPRVDARLHRSPWRAGRRVVDADGAPLTVADIEIGGFRTGFPEGATRDELGSPLILVKLEPGEVELPAEQQVGMPSGILGFSKICPHAGCAVSMYRHPLYEPTTPKPALVCPCHYSTFDVRRGGELIFGPAGRALPRLPLRVNAEDELVADGDYLDAYGPSWSGVRQERPAP